MRTAKGALLISVLILSAHALSADTANNKPWILYEQGNTAASQKEFGLALQRYKSAIESAGVFPEAEVAVGDVYLEEGEAALAQRQYEKAYDLRKSLYIPDDQYAIQYKLASLFEMQRLYKQMEEALGAIVADDKRYQETPTQRLRTQVERNYLEKGLDRVIGLYSFNDSFASAAHSKLGWFYYRTGRYTQALSHLVYSVIYRASEVQKYAREGDVDKEFTTLAELLNEVDRTPELREYASSAGLFRDLYYLAGSTFAAGYPKHSTTIWKLLSGLSAAGQYSDLSARQLKRPFIEPLLSVQR